MSQFSFPDTGNAESNFNNPCVFNIEKAINQITGDHNYEQIYVTFEEKLHADLFYRVQPYFHRIVAHKLSHLRLLPYVKDDPTEC